MSRGDWSLRLARAGDATSMPAIEAAAGAAFAEIEGVGTAGSHTMPVPQLQKLILKGHSLVAHVEGTMVGFLVNEPFGRELHICCLLYTSDAADD